MNKTLFRGMILAAVIATLGACQTAKGTKAITQAGQLAITKSGLTVKVQAAVKPAAARHVQTVVTNNTALTIDHVDVKLFDGATQVGSTAQMFFPADAAKTVKFTNLRANINYTIKAYAYDVGSVKISIDATSQVALTVSNDDVVSAVTVPVFLTDVTFNGSASGSTVNVNNGGYTAPALPEAITVL